MKNITGLKRWSKEARYQIYLKGFNEKKASLAAKGVVMYDNSPLSLREYTSQYEAIKATKEKLGKPAGNINRQIINDQAYELSQAKAASMTYAGLRTGLIKDDQGFRNIVQEVRSGKHTFTTEQINKMIEARYSELRLTAASQGIKPNQFSQWASSIIKTEFFWES